MYQYITAFNMTYAYETWAEDLIELNYFLHVNPDDLVHLP